MGLDLLLQLSVFWDSDFCKIGFKISSICMILVVFIIYMECRVFWEALYLRLLLLRQTHLRHTIKTQNWRVFIMIRLVNRQDIRLLVFWLLWEYRYQREL